MVFSTPFSISYNSRTRKLNIFLSLRIPDKTTTANSRSQLKTTGQKIEIVEINTGVHSTDPRVTSSKTANFTKISQNIPTFQSSQTKATRPKAKF